jgi:HlyD family secretion protein
MEESGKTTIPSDMPKTAPQENSTLAPTNGTTGSKPSSNITGKKRKRKFRSWAIILSSVIIVGAGVWYFFLRSEGDAPPFIRFAVADNGDITKSVTATGSLAATTTVQVGSQVSGRIKALHADFNTHVKKGDLVAEIDPTFFEAAVEQAEANYAKATSDLEIAQRNADRNKNLFSKSLIAQADLDQTDNILADAKSNVKQQKASLDQAKVNLSYTKIMAPISGIVTQRSVDVGQTVAASLSAPVLFIIAEDLKYMEVDANVDEADVGQVRDSEDVTFTVDAFPGEKFHGTVKMVRLNPIVTSNVVTYTVVITAPNPNEKLFPGMTATVSIVNASVQNVLRVPVAATRFTPPGLEASAAKPAGMGDTSKMKMKGDSSKTRQRPARSEFSTIYRRAANQKPNAITPELEPIKVKTGISDGMLSEIVWSEKPINPGDSIAVGAIVASKAAANAPGSNPFGTAPRPGGGGGPGGGAGRGR